MFVLALSLYNTWNRGVFLLCKITNLLIYSNMIVDVRPVGVGGNDKSVFALQKPLCKLVADAVGFLRRNFPRLEGLPHLIGDDITFLAAPGGLLIQPFRQ